MTPAELETFVRQRYNAVGDSFYPQAEIYNLFWQAQMELALETYCIDGTYTTTSVASQRAYDYPTNAISIKRVEYNGDRLYPNDFIDDDYLTGNNPGDTSTGTPENYQVWQGQLYLRPIPSTSALTIKVFSYDMPQQPISSSTLDVPSQYHLFLADFALYSMFAKDKDLQMARHHLEVWQQNKAMVLRAEQSLKQGDQFSVVKDIADIIPNQRYY